MTAATAAAATARVFWKCTAKGCRTIHVTDLETYGPRRMPIVRGEAGEVHAIQEPYFRSGMSAGSREALDAAWKAAGLMCEAHGNLMTGTVLAATYNPEKECDGRCLNARRASCECSCRGANHGGRHL